VLLLLLLLGGCLMEDEEELSTFSGELTSDEGSGVGNIQ
jgi:hypothetical protein